MFSQTHRYPSKILLIGEYTVLTGGSGLSLPWRSYGAQWVQDRQAGPEFHDFIAFLAQDTELAGILHLEALEQDHLKGWRLHSDIPFGAGLGSSGVLCAAIFDRYQRMESHDLARTKAALARMEQFFHGRSSGLDPLVSFLGKPVLSRGDSLTVIESMPPLECDHYRIRLVDSGKPRETRSLVERFRQRMSDDAGYAMEVHRVLMPLNEAAITHFLQEDSTALIKDWKKISETSLSVFRDMIPESMRQAWTSGLASGRRFIKLCGAGGGGYFLELTTGER